MFDAALETSPRDFTRTCQLIGRSPMRMLDAFDMEPWRWMHYFSPASEIGEAARALPFPPEVRTKLDDVRRYVELPAWRRVLAPR